MRTAPDFRRAINTKDLGVIGDPERWGSDGELSVAVPMAGVDRVVESSQIVRAQCADLVARAWELVSVWSITGLSAGDAVTFELLVTMGSGQTSATGALSLIPSIIAPVPSPWVQTPTGGTMALNTPIPASAVAVRLRMHVTNAGGDPAHTVVGKAAVMIAPRALS